MSYHIHITVTAERDVINASDHIEFVLKNPKAADDLLDEAEQQIYSLADFPEKFKLVDDPVLASWSVRFVVVNGYLASRLFVTITFYPAGRKSITENSIVRLHSAVNHAPMQPDYNCLPQTLFPILTFKAHFFQIILQQKSTEIRKSINIITISNIT